MMVSVENENGDNSSAGNTSSSSFPLTRVKKIMKSDKDVNLVSAEAVHLTSIASVHFGVYTVCLRNVGIIFGIFCKESNRCFTN